MWQPTVSIAELALRAAIVYGFVLVLLRLSGKPQTAHLRRERISLPQLHTILRRQGIHDLSEIHEAVLESNGTVTVVRTSELARPA